ncbi:hypothetical protein BDY17DRAFT_158883 [Neohortaea acidophila]|uniref:Uncharacterized protein n=1 Tax=Neohortaea acidophila TaxID=245834 RepID=A0A6A6PQT5_9PEZI|nr:uncharacterized protein BDY17DRAFT_158883 [Neohortaea acidophila]KAF2482372.1 hypothetical protein BDY17DRAFT_158883 [Neohortaea acidophila]
MAIGFGRNSLVTARMSSSQLRPNANASTPLPRIPLTNGALATATAGKRAAEDDLNSAGKKQKPLDTLSSDPVASSTGYDFEFSEADESAGTPDSVDENEDNAPCDENCRCNAPYVSCDMPYTGGSFFDFHDARKQRLVDMLDAIDASECRLPPKGPLPPPQDDADDEYDEDDDEDLPVVVNTELFNRTALKPSTLAQARDPNADPVRVGLSRIEDKVSWIWGYIVDNEDHEELRDRIEPKLNILMGDIAELRNKIVPRLVTLTVDIAELRKRIVPRLDLLTGTVEMTKAQLNRVEESMKTFQDEQRKNWGLLFEGMKSLDERVMHRLPIASHHHHPGPYFHEAAPGVQGPLPVHHNRFAPQHAYHHGSHPAQQMPPHMTPQIHYQVPQAQHAQPQPVQQPQPQPEARLS